MIKRKFIIITMSRESFDYDPLLNYLKDDVMVYTLYIISSGFFIEIVYDRNEDYEKLMKLMNSLEVKEIKVYPVIEKTFLSDILLARKPRNIDLYDGENLDGT
jgi:hypothetical protein